MTNTIFKVESSADLKRGSLEQKCATCSKSCADYILELNLLNKGNNLL